MQATKLNKLSYEFLYGKNENIDILIASDIHFDNPHCDRELFFSHLDRIRKKKGKVFIIGDLFCFMQGKYDPRRNKSDIRPEHNKADYINAVINDTVELLSPYKDIIAFVSEGNHEASLLKNIEVDVLNEFVIKYNTINKTNILKGGYRGWIIIRKEVSGRSMSHKMYYNHGYGGGGEMSKGILQHSRMNMHVEGADAIIMGHVHEAYVQANKRVYFNNNPGCFNEKERIVWNLRSACYKEEFVGSDSGFHIEKGRPPKPLGGIYANLEAARSRDTNAHTLLADYTMWIE